jgi:hypothetical protein
MTPREVIPAHVPEEVEAEVSAALNKMVADERRYAGSPWLPMHTAPKDGTHILIGYHHDYAPWGEVPDIEWVCDVAFLMKSSGLIDGRRDYQIHFARNGDMPNIPDWYTHWMPLPNPPEAL